MSIGQIAEILTMAVLGMFLKRPRWRTTMVIGILGHAVRFGVFAFLGEPHIHVAHHSDSGVARYLLCVLLRYGYIFVDEFFPKDIRTSAQGLFNLVILVSEHCSPDSSAQCLLDYYTTDKGTPAEKDDFKSLFTIPARSGFARSDCPRTLL